MFATATETSPAIALGPASVRLLAEGATTGGEYCLLDVETTARLRVPALVHRREELSLLVLTGSLRVECDRVPHELGPGETARLPRRLPHRVDAAPGSRFLCLARPCGLEALIRALADPLPPPDDVAALLAAHDVQPLPNNARA